MHEYLETGVYYQFEDDDVELVKLLNDDGLQPREIVTLFHRTFNSIAKAHFLVKYVLEVLK